MPKKSGESGKYVVVRNDMAGVLCGVLVCRDALGLELAEARIIWEWNGPGIETVCDVALMGPGISAKVSAKVPTMFVRANPGEVCIPCSEAGEKALREATWAK
jgi:hypothetical protein